MGAFADITATTLVVLLVLIRQSISIETPSSQKEKSSIEWLNLSPWELHSLNDLLIEVGLLSCPHMDKPSARSMKGFISEAVKKAERKEVMNRSFLQVYNNLVQCMVHMHDQSQNPGKVMESAAAHISNDQVKYSEESLAIQKEQNEKGWLANAMIGSKAERQIKEEILMNEPQSYTTPSISESDSDSSESDNVPAFLHQVFSWLTDYNLGQLFVAVPSRSKRDAGEPAKENVNTNPHTESALKDESQNFQKMYMILIAITSKTCPRVLRLNNLFSYQLARELAYYISDDDYHLSVASQKYFEKAKLLKQAQKCLFSYKNII